MPSPATPGRAGTASPAGQATSLPGWRASHWFNTPTPVELGDLRGRVVLVHAFQMLCPACVSHGLPQALRVHEAFQGEAVTVIGLHTVFEHHEVMGSQALQAFIQEYRLPFPIGIDQAAEAGPLPVTMAQWGLRGTPSVVLFDGVIVFFLQIDTLGPKNVKRDKHLQNRLFEVPCAFGAN